MARTVMVAMRLALGGMALAVSMSGALAQGKDLSDKSVVSLMNYAWALTPPKFTTPQGKIIEVDKSKPQAVIVPIETGRDIVRAARLTAYAQMCDLVEEQGVNYQTMMNREIAKAKWSDQSLLYISQLHLFTVMTMTGKVNIVERDGDKEVIIQEGKPVKTDACTETERQKIKEQIRAYLSTSPPAGGASTSTGSIAAPTQAPTPTSAPQKSASPKK